MVGRRTAAGKGSDSERVRIPALKVPQWMESWEIPDYKEAFHARPKPHFYVFSMDGPILRALSDVNRRAVAEGKAGRAFEIGIQRRHEERRSQQIADYVRHGYPWSDLPVRQRADDRKPSLMRPGWLPTAIVVNILDAKDKRRANKPVDPGDLLQIESGPDGLDHIVLPAGCHDGSWKPRGSVFPLEVIDGQHRLWAFDHLQGVGKFHLPVVAFHGLDLGWQAYLFWSINVKPKRISSSLAFDLYPLLRSQEWLESSGDLPVYREARSQELVQALWAVEQSPWFHRINLLGDPGMPEMASQATWVRALTTSFYRSPVTRKGFPGLFTGPLDGGVPLPWAGAQEAAFLITFGRMLQRHISESKELWAKELRQHARVSGKPAADDAAFSGPYSLLNQDQGINALLVVLNDLCVADFHTQGFSTWGGYSTSTSATDPNLVGKAVDEIARGGRRFIPFLEDIAAAMSGFDWRSASFPELNKPELAQKQALRGTGGYAVLRDWLLEHVETNASVAKSAAANAKRAWKK